MLKYIISSSLIKIEVLESNEDKFNCETLGHDFGEWEVTSLSKYDVPNENIDYWKRTCKRCKLVDVSSVNPTEINISKNK